MDLKRYFMRVRIDFKKKCRYIKRLVDKSDSGCGKGRRIVILSLKKKKKKLRKV